MTTEQFKSGTKDVTRRLGWRNLRPGEQLMGVQKSQGLKKGEHVIRLHPIVVISAIPEPLCDIRRHGKNETRREGFPDMSPDEFIDMFLEHNGKKCLQGEGTPVNRIVFKHLSHCPGCLYPVAHLGDYCGECLCEDDGV